jgi:hypothetical protein
VGKPGVADRPGAGELARQIPHRHRSVRPGGQEGQRCRSAIKDSGRNPGQPAQDRPSDVGQTVGSPGRGPLRRGTGDGVSAECGVGMCAERTRVFDNQGPQP